MEIKHRRMDTPFEVDGKKYTWAEAEAVHKAWDEHLISRLISDSTAEAIANIEDYYDKGFEDYVHKNRPDVTEACFNEVATWYETQQNFLKYSRKRLVRFIMLYLEKMYWAAEGITDRRSILSNDTGGPVYDIGNKKYTRDEIIKVHEFWQKILDKQEIMRAIKPAIQQIEREDRSVFCYYAENCVELIERWYSKLGSWRREQKEVAMTNDCSLADYIAKDLNEQYMKAVDEGWEPRPDEDEEDEDDY